MIKILLSVIVLVLVVVLPAIGSWHARSSGKASVHLTFLGANKAFLSSARVLFYDAGKKLLATGQRDQATDTVFIEHPEVGTCKINPDSGLLSKEAKQQWDKCYDHHTLWLPQWMMKVRYAQIIHTNCYSRKKSVQIKRELSPLERFIWWIPMPHGYGLPSSTYSAAIKLKSEDCIH